MGKITAKYRPIHRPADARMHMCTQGLQIIEETATSHDIECL